MVMIAAGHSCSLANGTPAFGDATARTDGFILGTHGRAEINGSLDTLEMQLFLPEDAALRIFEFDRVIKNGILHLTFNKELSFTKDEITVQVVENKDIVPVAFQDKDAKKMTVYFPKLQSGKIDCAIIIIIISLYI
jgi:hypothetical protein